MKNTYCFADIFFNVETTSTVFLNAAKSYLCEKENGETTISISKEELEYERFEEIKLYGKNFSTNEYLEYIAIERKITDYLINKNVFLMHGALIEKDNKGYLFIASSGTGKTTHIGYWKQTFGNRVKIVNGDKPFLKIIDGSLYAYGTPWCGKEMYNINKKTKLAGIIELHRGQENKIKEETVTEIFPLLYQQSYKNDHKEDVAKTMLFLTSLKGKTSFYKLECNMSKEAAKVAYLGMNSTLTFEDMLDLDGKLTYITKGISMLPLIHQDKDFSTIVKLEGEPKINDVLLFKRDNGQYVLHRLIGKDEKGYICLGDNLFAKEYGLRRDQLLGVLTQVVRGNEIIKVTDESYLKYVKRLRRNEPIRIFFKRIRYYLAVIYHKLFKKKQGKGK